MASFRNGEEQGRAARALLATLKLERLWREDCLGPTPEGEMILARGGSPLSRGESVLFRAVTDLYAGTDYCHVHELLHLDDARLRPLGELLVALATPDRTLLERWLEWYARPL